MSKSIDLAVVDMEYKNAICYAPYGTIKPGDTVITSIGNGIVTETLYTYTDNELFAFFKRNVEIVPIRSVVQPISYEGVEI